VIEKHDAKIYERL